MLLRGMFGFSGDVVFLASSKCRLGLVAFARRGVFVSLGLVHEQRGGVSFDLLVEL